jgi:sugar/nucleoside kinase (ribokinase family)
MSLVIVGTFNLDTIETPYARRERIEGGSGTYSALAASFFTKPKIVGVVGDDFPEETIRFFKEREIDTLGLESRPGKTFFWEGHYDHDPNKRTTIKTEVNVLKGYKPNLPPSYTKTDILFLANIDPDLQEDILAQVEKPKIIGMDTINFWIEGKSSSLMETLKKVDIFFGNDEEFKMITGEINLIKAGKKLLQMGPSLVVIKKGEHGALLMREDFVFGVLAYPCEDVIDPTGAGDCFAGGFLGYLSQVQSFEVGDMRKAAVFGSVMASFAIEDFGIQRFRTLSSQDIEERYKSFKKLVSF